MPYTMQWYIPDRVAYTQYSGHISLEEFEAVISEIKQYLAEGTPPVHHIVDYLAVESVTDKTQLVKQALSQLELGKHGWAVIISSKHAYIRYQVFTLAQAAGVRYQEVTSLEGAVAFLMRADETLHEDEDTDESEPDDSTN